MASIPVFQRGRDLATVLVTPQIVSTLGALSDTTPVATITTMMRELQLALDAGKEEISAITSTKRNSVVVDDGFSLNLTILKVNNGSDPNPLRLAITTADIFKVSWTEGSGGSQKSHTLYASRGSLSEGFSGKGSQIASLSFDSVDAGTAWITRT
jgi:hypothetical protein